MAAVSACGAVRCGDTRGPLSAGGGEARGDADAAAEVSVRCPSPKGCCRDYRVRWFKQVLRI